MLISQTSQSWYYVLKIQNSKYHKIWKYASSISWENHIFPLLTLSTNFYLRLSKHNWWSSPGKMSLGSSPVRISAVANCWGHSMSQSERNSSDVLVGVPGVLAGCEYVNGLMEGDIRLMSSSSLVLKPASTGSNGH